MAIEISKLISTKGGKRYVAGRWLELASPRVKSDYKSEPRHDKTNKMSVRPAKTQISLGICPVLSESSLALIG